MDLRQEYSPLIETALGRMAPGEKIGWVLDSVTLPAEQGSTVRGLQLTLFAPSPLVGQVIHWAFVITNPLAALENNGAALDEILGAGLKAIRDFASRMLTQL